jgi:hypothetical protein
MTVSRSGGGNLLRNHGFDHATVSLEPSRDQRLLTRPTVAEYWMTHRYSASTEVTTDLVPTTLPHGLGWGETTMLHVCTTGLAEIVQDLPVDPTRSVYVKAAAWVFVVRGQVSLGMGPNAALVRAAATTTKVGEWEYLEGRNGVQPIGCLVIGCAVPTMEEGACFYVGHTLVQEISEQEWAVIDSETRGLVDVSHLASGNP